jgi:probable HAF family extracellular repeat protein
MIRPRAEDGTPSRGSRSLNPKCAVWRVWLVGCMLWAWLLIAPHLAHATRFSFQGLGFLPGELSSGAYAVSAHGTVVVGVSGSQSYRWTPNRGMVALPSSPGSRYSFASGVSADGTVIVGMQGGMDQVAYRWTGRSGMALSKRATATGVSADGSVVIGVKDSVAFRWTPASGMTLLGFLPNNLNNGMFLSEPHGVSADGSVVVGFGSGSSPYYSEAFRWTAEEGMVSLGFLPTLGESSSASAVSADGSVIVGASGTFNRQAFRWTAETGMVGLGFVPGMRFSGATGISANGKIIVGWIGTGSGYWPPDGDAFVWTEELGMVSLRDLLVSNGVNDVEGWTLSGATAISADGTTIVGTGFNPHGDLEAWRATIVIPEPSAWVLAAVGAIGGLLLVRQVRR